MVKASFDIEQYARRQQELSDAISRARVNIQSPSEPASMGVQLAEAERLEVARRLFSRALQSDGLRTALYSLLRKTEYRYATVFKFDGLKNRAIVHVDRQQLMAELPAEFPISQSYCQFVLDKKRPFLTIEASDDEATIGHAKRDVFQAYCGIPIMAPDGEVLGSLCYYDEEPRGANQLDLELLLHAASAIEQSGLLVDERGS